MRLKLHGLDEEAPVPAACVVPGKIGVVTVLFNSAGMLPDFFVSIESQTYKNFVVYCVDNASADGSARICAGRGSLYEVIPNQKNVGVAAGNNQGIRAAITSGCEYVLFLNNDVSFPADLFEQLVEGIHRHHADMTTPMIYFADPPNLIWCAGGGFFTLGGYRPIHYGEFTRDTKRFAADSRIDYAPTCCVLAKTASIHTIGLMDERYFVYWDDVDWMLRAKRAGASLWYLGGARLWHKVSSLTGGREAEFSVRYTRRNKAYFLYKNVNRPGTLALRIGYSTYYLLLALLPRRRKKAWLCFRSWQEGAALYKSATKAQNRSVMQASQQSRTGSPSATYPKARP